ncbi:hypothetical protein Pan241w_27850 [Gimesia alba]|uniref:Type I restriction enzyme R protein N-terminal domain-containing protein n=1 Tax=Gimesia alba TaxID=2527973 RepID=A0A517RFQ3_9PLAN|nr:ATP-binding protein [Gimesia alba]QDT42697.1 hypothetical protein Pan241w_27850 [Gimesia alba]
MAGKRLKLEAKEDFVKRLCQASPLDAIEELIWNSFDENAKEVEVSFKLNQLDGIEEINIEDNGHSLSYLDAAEKFTNLGQSDKVNRRRSTGEHLHGRRGEGRHKALSIGEQVTWRFTYYKGKTLYVYEIIGTSNRSDPFYLCEEKKAPPGSFCGCLVTINKINKRLGSLLESKTCNDLAARFAQFLLSYPDFELKYNNRIINPQNMILDQRKIRKYRVDYEGERYDVSISMVEWKSSTFRKEAFLCRETGIPLHKLSDTFLGSSNSGTAFIKSSLFEILDEENNLQTIENTTNDHRKEVMDSVRRKIKSHYRKQKQLKDSETINSLKIEGSYPYTKDAQSSIGKVEQHAFDMCAISINRHLPNFSDGMDAQGRTFLLRMIKETLTQDPSAVGKVMRELFKLREEDIELFADLLEDTPLSKIVHTIHLITQRLEFLKTFKAVTSLDIFEKTIYERTQLQKLISPNTWIFGEEYSLGTDDEDIRSILLKHIDILGRQHLDTEISDQDIKKIIKEYNQNRKNKETSLKRVPDFMIWKKFKERRADEYEFLVIEIKRPGVSLDTRELNQIEDYARAVSSTSLVDQDKTKWVFVVVSDSLADAAIERAHQQNMPPYTISQPSHGKYEVRAFPWSAIIQSAEGRHEFLKDRLSHNIRIETALERSQKKYQGLIPRLKKKKVG